MIDKHNRNSPMEIFKNQVIQDIIEGVVTFFFKWWVVGSYIMMAIVTKFSFDRSRGLKLSFWEALWQIIFSMLIGAWSAVICVNMNKQSQTYWIVPLATLLADKIYLYLVYNWKVILFGFIKVINILPVDKESEKKDENNL